MAVAVGVALRAAGAAMAVEAQERAAEAADRVRAAAASVEAAVDPAVAVVVTVALGSVAASADHVDPAVPLAPGVGPELLVAAKKT